MRFHLPLLALAAFVCFAGNITAQQAGTLVVRENAGRKMPVAGGKYLPDLALLAIKDTAAPRPTFRLSPSLVVEKQGWFCNRELQVQKATRLPLYFRLGSKDYADRMEGKLFRLQ